MRYLRFLALLPLVMIGWTGCGGGGSSTSASRTAMVTLQFQWPTAGRAPTRAFPGAINFATVEVFVGTQRIAQPTFTLTAGQLTSIQTISLPVGDVTFYVNAYNAPVDPLAYVTDPKTGQVLKNGVPLNSADTNPPVAHATSTQTVAPNNPVLPSANQIVFTLNNTITSLSPVPGTTSFTLGSGAHDLNSTVQAKDANGAVVLVTSGELTWALDTTDTFAAKRASLTAAGVLTPLAAGDLRITVTDSKVNVGQASIQTTIGYTINNPGGVTLIIDPANLSAACPLYAKSVTLTVIESALQAGDNPPATAPITQNTTFNPGPGLPTDPITAPSVTIPGLSTPFTFTGRLFHLKVDAWSNSDGQGVLIASTVSTDFASLTDPALTQVGANYTYNKTLFAGPDYRITGFSLSPAVSSIYFFNAGQAAAGLSSTVALQAALVGPGVTTTNQFIDPRTLLWASNKTSATVSNAVSTPPAGTVTAQPVGADTAVTVTATDRRVPATLTPGTAAVTVKPVVGSGGFNID